MSRCDPRGSSQRDFSRGSEVRATVRRALRILDGAGEDFPRMGDEMPTRKLNTMNDTQERAFRELQSERRRRGARAEIVERGERDGYAFIEVDGVTVLIGPKGGFLVPAVRSYPGTGKPGERAVDAAADPGFFFNKQAKDRHLRTGHFHPIVNTDWRCESTACPCRDEKDESLRKYRSLGKK